MTGDSQSNPARSRVVSFDDESLILVDPDDRVLGFESKQAAHDGPGKLHRAFSIFLFNGRGELLLQQRSAEKRLWPLFWSNSCCSHPRRGEQDLEAAQRRIDEELGVSPNLTYLFRFEYQARYRDAGSEHELCTIYAARSDAPVRVNVHEVAACRSIAPAVLDRELKDHPDAYTPWLKLEWPRIRRDHWPQVQALFD
ncbi:MAG: isopentenyl-diphosphate delta-isomerase [Salinisphaeraceae bacterium]|nr:isopentenyl-diphosphate delta-isomerase [Salinisphaeraceae bacterium]